MIEDVYRLLKLLKVVYEKGDQTVKDNIKLELKRIFPKLDISEFLD